jgi:hypothetical protein
MPGAAGLVLPTNEAPFVLMQFDDYASKRTTRRRIDSDEIGEVAFEHCSPVRRFPAYRGKRSHEGRYWFSSMGRHVRFESHFESVALSVLDFSRQATRVSSNPFWLLWPKGSTPARHAPDFFARLADGSALVIDVHPAKFVGERIRAQHAGTRQVCDRLGWRYVEFTYIDPAVRHNIALLGGYSRPHSAIADVMRDAVLDVAPPPVDGGIEFWRLVEYVEKTSDLTAIQVRGAILRLLWERRLHFDLLQPLCSESLVWR